MSLRDQEVAAFKAKLNALLSHHKELELAIHNKRNEASLKSTLAMQLILSACVLWQSFVHDLIVAYILMNPKHALASLNKKINDSLNGKFGRFVASKTKMSKITNINRSIVLSLIDPQGWNIAFQSAEKLTTRSNELLHARYAINFSHDPATSEFIDFILAIRNYLSHNSAGSRKKLVDAIKLINEVENNALKANIVQIGPYLKKQIDNNTTRAEFIINRLFTISDNF